MNTTNDEIKLLVKLRHPDPFTETDAFIDSLPEEVFSAVFLGKVFDDRVDREGSKQFLRDMAVLWLNTHWRHKVAEIRQKLFNYYEQRS